MKMLMLFNNYFFESLETKAKPTPCSSLIYYQYFSITTSWPTSLEEKAFNVRTMKLEENMNFGECKYSSYQT